MSLFIFWFKLGLGDSPAAAKLTKTQHFGFIVRSIFVDFFGSALVEVRGLEFVVFVFRLGSGDSLASLMLAKTAILRIYFPLGVC